MYITVPEFLYFHPSTYLLIYHHIYLSFFNFFKFIYFERERASKVGAEREEGEGIPRNRQRRA